jgi:hypothetical protein
MPLLVAVDNESDTPSNVDKGVPQLPHLCAEHVRQLEGESPFHNLMEVK